MPGQGLATQKSPQQTPAPAPAPASAPAVVQPRGNAAAAEAVSQARGGEAVDVIAGEISGEGRAKEMLQKAGPGDRGVVESATRQALGEEDGTRVIGETPAAGTGEKAPEVSQPQEAGQQEGEEGGAAQGEGEEGGEQTAAQGQDEEGGGKGDGQPGGGAVDGATTEAQQPQQLLANVSQLGTSDLALIHEELIEHQRWGGAATQVGEPGSAERAAFIAEKAGEGAVSGGLTGLGLGFAAGAVGKLAARFVPIPGVGAILGGAMSVYGLATRDWGQTADTIGKFGEGDSSYEVMANTIASISEVIQLVCDIMNVIAGVIGVISAVMWIVSIITVGAASPLAATLSAIALGIGAASGILDLINNLVLQPAVLLFRALHAFQSEADPREVEAQGAGISDASGRAAGALGGWVGGKAGEAAGSKGGDMYIQRRHGSGTAETGPQPTARTEMPDAPARTQGGDAPTARADTPETIARQGGTDAPRPQGADAPRPQGADAPTTQGADAPTTQGADGPQQQPKRGLAAVRERFKANLEAEARITQQRNQAIDDARSQARQQKAAEVETQRRQQHDQVDAEFKRRLQDPEVMQDRHRYEMEVMDSAHQHRMADLDAAGKDFQSSTQQADLEFQQRQQAIQASKNEQLQAVDQRRLDNELWLMDNRDTMSPETYRTMKQQFDLEHSQARRQIVEDHGPRTQQAIDDYNAAYKQASERQRRATTEAETRYTESRRSAMEQYDAEIRQPFDARKAQADADAAAQVDAAGNAAATAATPDADAAMASGLKEQRGSFWTLREHWEMLKATPEALLNPETRAAAGQDLSDAMVRSRLDYANGQESWRPEWWQRTLGRSKLVDFILYPFAEDLAGPAIVRGRTNAGRQGNPARANEKLGPLAVKGGQEIDRQVNDREEQEREERSRAQVIASGRYTPDNPGMAEHRQPAGNAALDPTNYVGGGVDSPEWSATLDNTERVDPDYEDPPAAPEQLDLILDQIEQALAARAQAEGAELQMTQQGQAHQANQAPIQECVDETQSAVTAQQAHAEAVARRQSANAEQQARQQEAQGLLEGGPERMAGLTVITGPLKAFQGFTWLASKLPGGAGRAMASMNADANRMSEAFDQMEGTFASESAKGADAQAQLQGDSETLTTVQEEAGTSATNVDTAQQGAQGLQQANETAVADAAAAEAEARGQKEELDGAIETKRTEHQSLTTQLTGWAQRHREARMVALAQQQQNAAASTVQAAPAAPAAAR